jgi:hypothetical protein
MTFIQNRYNSHKKILIQNKMNYISNNETFIKIFPEIDEWPKSWAGDDKDIPVGEAILKYIKEFLMYQQTQVSKKTLRDYGQNLWHLGGEIIRETNGTRIKAQHINEKFMFKYISDVGGIYCRHLDSEKEYDRYNYTCRILYKYINENLS